MTLAWGIAATGGIARTVGRIIAGHPDMRVAAVGSRSGQRARAFAAELEAPASYGSYSEMVEDPAVQAVYVATPHAQHAGVAELALSAGRGVLCEKPLTASLADTQRLVAFAQQRGVFLMEAMWTRFNPLVRRLKDLVDAGALGEIRTIRASFGFVAPYDAQSRLWNPALGGGALLDIGVYPVDLAHLLLGPPAQVTATGSLAPTGVDAEATVTLGWEGGAQALLETSFRVPLPGTAVIVGSAGHAELGPSFHAPTRLVVECGGAGPETWTVPDRNAGFIGELDEVARCLAEGRLDSEVHPLSATLATMRVLEQARRQIARSPARGGAPMIGGPPA